MGLIAEIARSVGVGVHQSGPTELVSGADLIKLLGAVRSRGMSVLGLEGFRIVGGRLVPEMNAIADFSTISGSADSEETVAEALRFISRVGEPDLLYDVTFGEDGE